MVLMVGEAVVLMVGEAVVLMVGLWCSWWVGLCCSCWCYAAHGGGLCYVSYVGFSGARACMYDSTRLLAGMIHDVISL